MQASETGRYPAAAPQGCVSGCMGKVLVIDDEEGPRESLRILLKNDYLNCFQVL